MIKPLYYNSINIDTLFIATIALVAPFIPVEIEVLAYSACEHKIKTKVSTSDNKDSTADPSKLTN